MACYSLYGMIKLAFFADKPEYGRNSSVLPKQESPPVLSIQENINVFHIQAFFGHFYDDNIPTLSTSLSVADNFVILYDVINSAFPGNADVSSASSKTGLSPVLKNKLL